MVLERSVSKYKFKLIVLLIGCMVLFSSCSKEDGLEQDKVDIEKICSQFISSITCREYEEVTGYEGYECFSDELVNIMENQDDPRLTKEIYVKGKLEQTLIGEPDIIVTMTDADKAEVTAYYKEMFNSPKEKWCRAKGIECNVERNIFTVLNLEKDDAETWKIVSYDLQDY